MTPNNDSRWSSDNTLESVKKQREGGREGEHVNVEIMEDDRGREGGGERGRMMERAWKCGNDGGRGRRGSDRVYTCNSCRLQTLLSVDGTETCSVYHRTYNIIYGFHV